MERREKVLIVLAVCTYPGAKLSCAAYSRDGQLLSVATLPVREDSLSREYRFTLRGGACHHVRLLLLDSAYHPLCSMVQTL